MSTSKAPISPAARPSSRPDVAKLQAALRFFQKRGWSGEVVWRHGQDIERSAIRDGLGAHHGLRRRLDYYGRLVTHFEQFAGAEHKYVWLPVDMETFLTSKEMLNYEEAIYPEVMKALIEANSGRYVEAVWTGGIGVGKTTGALLSQIFQLYLLLCLKTPQYEFGLDPASEILIVFQSMTKTLSKTLDYGRFKGMIEAGPFFADRGRPIKVTTDEMEFKNHIRVKPLSGSHHAAIGQNIFSALVDEINFMAKIEKSKLSEDGGGYDQAMSIYNAIVRRRKSRFMSQGKLP